MQTIVSLFRECETIKMTLSQELRFVEITAVKWFQNSKSKSKQERLFTENPVTVNAVQFRSIVMWKRSGRLTSPTHS